MNVETEQRPYDLEERTFLFASQVRKLIKRMPRTIGNYEDGKQLVRSSGSVGANYIEANESLGDKDFLMRVKISRKEDKESRYWLRLLDLDTTPEHAPHRCELIQEADQLVRIFSAIIRKRG